MNLFSQKNVAEFGGVVAIVASLIFVGLQLRQSQEIALAEGFSMMFSTQIEVNNSIKEHVDLWRSGTAGEELSEDEAAVFSILVAQVNASAVLAYVHMRQIGGTSGAEFTPIALASFLYQNPGARKVWLDRERNLSKYRSALIDDYSGHSWVDKIQSYLAELDQKNIPLEKYSYVDW